MKYEEAMSHLRSLKVLSLNNQPEECALAYGEALNAIQDWYDRVEKTMIILALTTPQVHQLPGEPIIYFRDRIENHIMCAMKQADETHYYDTYFNDPESL